MIIIKLGGSLYDSPKLKLWLAAIAEQAKQQSIIIVPGGGPFADQVREAQHLHQFDDGHAHHMAILAMAQFGLLIAGIEQQCQLFYYPVDKSAPPQGLSVWLPNQQLVSDTVLGHSWGISADSLALWLANELNAEQLILIKQSNDLLGKSLTELSKLSVIDNGFPQLFLQIPTATQIINVQHHQQLSARLTDNSNLVHYE